MDIDLKEKLDKVKEEYKDDEDLPSKALEWEEKIRKSSSWKEFSENEVTKEIVASLRKRVVTLRIMLARSRDTEVMANVGKYWAVIDEAQYWLKTICFDYKAELKSIEAELALYLSQ